MKSQNIYTTEIATNTVEAFNECELNNISIENEEISDADLMEINGGVVALADLLVPLIETADAVVRLVAPGLLAP